MWAHTSLQPADSLVFYNIILDTKTATVELQSSERVTGWFIFDHWQSTAEFPIHSGGCFRTRCDRAAHWPPDVVKVISLPVKDSCTCFHISNYHHKPLKSSFKMLKSFNIFYFFLFSTCGLYYRSMYIGRLLTIKMSLIFKNSDYTQTK